MIAVLDYGIGNLRSAEKALLAVGADARLVERPGDAAGASGIVLPGVGAFGACAAALRESGLEEVVRRALDAHIPFLGVCVGFQLLFEGSEESPDATGLGVLSGTVRRLSGDDKLPQIQWNPLDERRADSLMLAPFSTDPWFYFVHSYAPVPEGDAVSAVAATADYGGRFVAAIERDHLWGVQFHPEKSGPNGLALLAGFVAAVDRSVPTLSLAG